ncbi:hypothetical protein [Cognatilysobacter bugurensis]|uniref:Uncharacterized protein n=1 Tax=Cognatilysobacter bugurensis TaxID=543356 RepID=A0A918SVY6_9GAMM|nr:hypothetical protein [Lysobacter bugurensis]GHA72720.1 hypothetical protein GCM10007067_06580 [Lysobacter bugurensis]
MNSDRNDRRLSRSEELERLDREVTGNAVNARTDDTKRVTHNDAERLDRKYAADDADRSDS